MSTPVDTAASRRPAETRRSGPYPGGLQQRLKFLALLGLQYLLLGAGLVATTLGSAFLSFSLAIRGNEIAVPDLTGASLPAAAQVLARVELNLKAEGRRHDEQISPDRIMAQEPPPGTMLKKGRSVKVWVSLGPRRRSVPRVEGESLPSAQLILEQNGFSLGRVAQVASENYSPDTVIAQDPPPYSETAEPGAVALLVSQGNPGAAYVMPDFIGRDISDVLDRVRAGGLRISSIRYQDYPGVSRGLVVRQTPLAGSKVYYREPIVLYVSKGS